MICPYCGGTVEREKGVKPSEKDVGMFRNRMYHPECYQKARKEPKKDWPAYIEKAKTEEGAFDLALKTIIDYFNIDLKISPNIGFIASQLKSLRKRASYEDIIMALRYGYEIKHLDKSKSNGGIGIIPYIIDDAQHYFERHEIEKMEFARKIKEQMENFANKERVVKIRRKKEKQKIAFFTDDD